MLLQYANDTMFLLEGTSEAVEKASAMLDILLDFLGLCLNREKSTLVTFGMSEEEATRCSSILATPRECLPHQRPQHAAICWTSINSKLATGEQESGAATRGMEGSLLFRDSRLVLIKAVLSVIPTFFLSILWARVPFGIGLLQVCADSYGEEPDKGTPEG